MSNWNETLQMRADIARVAVLEAIKKVLMGRENETTTGQLAELIYPEKLATNAEGLDARKALYRILLSRWGALDPYRTRAPAEANRYGHMIQRWRWRLPVTKHCPHCGGLI